MFRFTKTIIGRALSVCFAAYAATVPVTSNNDICNRSQHCNFNEAQAESSADDGFCKPKHVGATIIILNDFNCVTIL